MISQISSLLLTVLSGSVPPFSLPTLLGMAVCGVLGGIAGRCVNRRIPSATVDRLFIGMMGLILDTRTMVAMQGLGYKEILDYLDGRCTLDEAVYVLKRDTRHFAKRQLTWFRRERDVRWIKLEDYEFDKSRILEGILNNMEKTSE